MGVSTITIKETTNITTKTSRLPKFVRRKEKKDSVEQEEKKQQKPPKSPLMSVAHSVKVFLMGVFSNKYFLLE